MKPGAFTQLYVHLVLVVKYRDNVLHKKIRNQVFGYMSGILTHQKHKSIIINGVSDHVHILFGLNPAKSVSDTVHDLKRSSSLFINTHRLCFGKFAWQEGYGAFSYSRSQIDTVYRYIENQEQHHRKESFRDEYIGFLEKYGVDYEPRFLFEFFDDRV